MKLGDLEVTLHRTVRVKEGRAPSSLPPSLGVINAYKVSDYKKNCPPEWADDAYFVALHDTEAMWIAFDADKYPSAVLLGCGGVNALSGRMLGLTLEKDNYMVCPPQPWIDGWKDVDGTVHQFVATPHKKGDGISVAEQIIGKDSKTGAIGIAVFEPKDPSKFKEIKSSPGVFSGSPVGTLGGMTSTSFTSCSVSASSNELRFSASDHSPVPCASAPIMKSLKLSPASSRIGGSSVTRGLASKPAADFVSSDEPVIEMGIGKGGRIKQKIYQDPYGLKVWKTDPVAVFAMYLVDAVTAERIAGEKVQTPVTHDKYNGHFFDLDDDKLPDVLGTAIFSGLKSAAFPAASKTHESTKDKDKTATDVSKVAP